MESVTAGNIEKVVRSITEPYAATEITANVDKYFTEDAYIEHPLFNQPCTKNSREALKGIYKMLRVFSLNQKIDFVATMISEDKTQATIELIEHLDVRFVPFKLRVSPRFITRIGLRQDPKDKLWRIYRQQDNFPTDLGNSGLIAPPGVIPLVNLYKGLVGIATGAFGIFLLRNGLLGA